MNTARIVRAEIVQVQPKVKTVSDIDHENEWEAIVVGKRALSFGSYQNASMLPTASRLMPSNVMTSFAAMTFAGVAPDSAPRSRAVARMNSSEPRLGW